jgi:hypothetical protein
MQRLLTTIQNLVSGLPLWTAERGAKLLVQEQRYCVPIRALRVATDISMVLVGQSWDSPQSDDSAPFARV